MTDFAKPTTPAEALRKSADAIDYRVKENRRKIAELNAVNEALLNQQNEILSDADRYEKYQPKSASGGDD